MVKAPRVGAVKRVKMTVTVRPETRAAMLRLNAVSGMTISRLLEEFLKVEVLDSISEGLELARSGMSASEISSRMYPFLSQHILGANESLKDFRDLGNNDNA